MKTKLLYLTIILIFAAISCKQDDCCDSEKEIFSKSYITRFYIPDTLYFWNAKNLEIESGKNYSIVGLSLDGKEFATNLDEFTKKYGDTTFNSFTVPFSSYSFTNSIDSINIYSNSDFDNEHKAGSSLNDISILETLSYFPFIKNGYKNAGENISNMSTIRKKICDLTTEDGHLWKTGNFTIYLTKKPTIFKTHNLTFKFFLDDGRVLCATTEYTFE